MQHTSVSLFCWQHLPDFAIINYFLYSSFSIYKRNNPATSHLQSPVAVGTLSYY
ncbi:hypothetical protein SALWKB2_2233 [Snodgrassella alvi wkB2]|nr:hypothetical protein SALWKB2_2233 [Snodgrassella alvi wkB2]